MGDADGKLQDVFLMVLGAAAGSADAWSYFGLGHAFVANMTGNTVLVGLAVFDPHGHVEPPAISLACYGAGVALASFLTRSVRVPASSERHRWPRVIFWTLLLEGLLLICAAVRWAVLQRLLGPPAAAGHDQGSLDALLACVALAIGMQSGAMLQLKIPGIVTTYITGTWTTLTSGLVRLLSRQLAQRGEQQPQFAERLRMQAVLLAVYLASAVLTGWLFRYLPGSVGVLPAACVLVTAGSGILRCG